MNRFLERVQRRLVDEREAAILTTRGSQLVNPREREIGLLRAGIASSARRSERLRFQRELVREMFAKGLGTKAIATRLGLSERSVYAARSAFGDAR